MKIIWADWLEPIWHLFEIKYLESGILGINGKGNGGSGGYVPSEHSRSDRCPVSLRDGNLDGDGNHDHTNGGNNGNKGNGGNGGNDGNGI